MNTLITELFFNDTFEKTSKSIVLEKNVDSKNRDIEKASIEELSNKIVSKMIDSVRKDIKVNNVNSDKK